MTRRCFGAALGVMLLGAAVAGAGESVLPFHVALQVTGDCQSSDTPAGCLDPDVWVAECQAMGYAAGFQAVRSGKASDLGRVTSVERGCLDFTPTGVARSNVQLTVTARRGRGALTIYANALFDFASWSAPLNPPPATGTFTITGGTGRYQQARGSGTLGNIFGEGNAGWTIYLDGSLWLPTAGQ
jgi:hypothetical protein